jgi:magnesium transporter NIPA
MNELVIAVILCIVSAAAYAGAAVLQERVASRPIGVLLRMPMWWAAIALNGAGAALHVVALRYGPLSLVQPFGVLTLVMAVPLASVIARRAVNRVERQGITLTVAGLIGILLLAGTTDSIAVLTTAQLVGLLLVTAALLTALGGWSAVPGASGLWPAAAGGVAFGVSSALTQTVAVHVSGDGLGALLDPAIGVAAAAIAVLSTAGLLFAQRSYRDGLGAPLAVSTLANPVAAAAIGLLLLQEQIAGGTLGAGIAVVAAVAAGIGVSLLTRAQTTKAAPVVSAVVEQPTLGRRGRLHRRQGRAIRGTAPVLHRAPAAPALTFPAWFFGVWYFGPWVFPARGRSSQAATQATAPQSELTATPVNRLLTVAAPRNTNSSPTAGSRSAALPPRRGGSSPTLRDQKTLCASARHKP